VHRYGRAQWSLTKAAVRELSCFYLDMASQGDTIGEARHNLVEAVELFLETANESEIQRRLHSEVYVTRIEVGVG
jgi:hypothetical protein